MYLGVDVGGSKTLVAVFEKDGKLQTSEKFPTPIDYDDFLQNLAQAVDRLSTAKFQAAAVAIPGRINRDEGIAISCGNLGWKNVTVQADCEKLFSCPVLVENDAKLAGLSEAKYLINDFERVLYLTISTGIGIAIINRGVIDTEIGDRGGNTIMLEHNHKVVSWESFASGKAIKRRYGKLASEIDDPDIWSVLSKDFAVGIIDLIAVLEPDVIVIGGGVGTHFKKFEKPLLKALEAYQTPMMKIPPIRQAKHTEEAVIYGCYELTRDRYGK